MAKSVSGKAFDLHLLAKILKYSKPYRFVFYGSFVLTLVLSALSTTRPILIQYVIDNFISEGNLQGLTNYMLILTVLLVMEALVQFLFIFGANYLGQSIIRDL